MAHRLASAPDDPPALASHVRQIEALYELSERALRAESLDAIHDAALDCLERALGCDRASILLFDADGVMRFKAHRGLSAGYRRAVEGHTPWKPEDADAQPIAVADAAADPALEPYRDTILREGIRALAFVPLLHQGRVLGKFMVYYDRPHAFGDPEIRLAQTIAGQISWGIARQVSADALREQKERYEGLVKAQGDLGDGILLIRERRVLWANDAAARMCGARLKQLLDPEFDSWSVLPVEEQARVRERMAARRAAGRRGDLYATRLRRLDGTELDVEVGVQDLDAEGTQFIVLRDISERVRREAELARARRELAMSEKLSAMGTLVNGVAHELRTPLASLSNAVHLMRSRVQRSAASDPELALLPGLAASALDDIDRINRLVLSLRRFTKGEADDAAGIPLRDAVERAVSVFEAAYRGRIELRHEMDPRAAPRVVSPEIQQVVINLLENAADASASGARVELRAVALDDGAVELRLRDHGVGIPKEVQPHIFDAFFTTKPEGTGLGLSIVRRIVDAHGGAIRVESAPGKGTTFVVTLPSSA